MAGTNPYIEKAEFELPQQNYNLIFQPMNKKVEILAEKITTENDRQRDPTESKAIKNNNLK